MAKFIVRGGKPLYGEIVAQGSKNSAVAILMACIAVKGLVTLWRVPFITDVLNCIEILKGFGAKVEWGVDGALRVDCRELKYKHPSQELTAKMRASTYLMGACLSRFGKCDALAFGGCSLGERPVNIHLEVLRKIGVENRSGTLFLEEPCGMAVFSRVTVGGTVNAILAAVCGVGECLFKNCAKEPHVRDLVEFLRNCGADIEGLGESEIRVRGVTELHGCEFILSGDMIEAGTYLISGVATGGDVTVRGVSPFEMVALNQMFLEMGYRVECGVDGVSVSGVGCGGNVVVTGEYPMFPTDLHPQTVALMGMVKGGGTLVENVFGSDRFAYVNELAKFGAKCCVEGSRVVVEGLGYHPANADATDLRGGAALVIAALCTGGESVIGCVEYIERGYSDFVSKLRSLGADIVCV